MVKARFSKSGREVNDFVSDSQERRTAPDMYRESMRQAKACLHRGHVPDAGQLACAPDACCEKGSWHVRQMPAVRRAVGMCPLWGQASACPGFCDLHHLAD